MPVRRLRSVRRLFQHVFYANTSAWGLDVSLVHIENGASLIRLGAARDVQPILTGPSYFLQGNGAPFLEAFQAYLD